MEGHVRVAAAHVSICARAAKVVKILKQQQQQQHRATVLPAAAAAKSIEGQNS